MRLSFLIPLGFLGLTGCVVETPAPTTTTYVTPAPTSTYVTPAYPTATYVAPTTVYRAP